MSFLNIVRCRCVPVQLSPSQLTVLALTPAKTAASAKISLVDEEHEH